MFIPIVYNLRSLRVRWATTLASAAGVALVVFVIASSLMLANGVRRTMVSAGDPRNVLVLRKGSDSELASSIENDQRPLVLSAPGVAVASDGTPNGTAESVIVLAMTKLGEEGLVANVQVRGVSPRSLEMRPSLRVVSGRAPRAGSDEAMVGIGVRGRFQGLELGQSFELKSDRRVQVVGVFEAAGSVFESEVWTDLETLRSSFGRDGVYSSITVQLASPQRYSEFKAALEGDPRLGVETFREAQYYEKQSEGTSTLVMVLGVVVGLLFSVAATLGGMITMFSAVSQRTREIGTLRALGFSKFAVLASFACESTLLALFGAGIGGLAALGMSLVHFSMTNTATWQEIRFSFDPTPKVLATSVAFGALLGLVGGSIPSRSAARTSPIEAMRG